MRGVKVTDRDASDPEVVKAKRAAVKLLAHRARPRGFLEQRLRRKGFSAPAIQSALDALAGAGYVDDAQYARDRIEGLLGKSLQWGPALIRRLVEDGIARELAEQAVAERLAGEDQRLWACRLARERMRTSARGDARADANRIAAYLSRRGFDHDVIFSAIEEVLPELNDAS